MKASIRHSKRFYVLQFERETGQQRRIYRSRKDTYGGQRKTCIAVKNTNLYYFSGLRPDPRFIALAPQGFRCRYLCFLEDRWPWSASWGDRKFRLFLTGNCVFDDRLRWLSAPFSSKKRRTPFDMLPSCNSFSFHCLSWGEHITFWQSAFFSIHRNFSAGTDSTWNRRNRALLAQNTFLERNLFCKLHWEPAIFFNQRVHDISRFKIFLPISTPAVTKV